MPLHLVPHPSEFTPDLFILFFKTDSPAQGGVGDRGRMRLQTLSRSSASSHTYQGGCPHLHFLPLPWISQPSTGDSDAGEKHLPPTALLCSHQRTRLGRWGQPVQWSLTKTSNACSSLPFLVQPSHHLEWALISETSCPSLEPLWQSQHQTPGHQHGFLGFSSPLSPISQLLGASSSPQGGLWALCCHVGWPFFIRARCLL